MATPAVALAQCLGEMAGGLWRDPAQAWVQNPAGQGPRSRTPPAGSRAVHIPFPEETSPLPIPGVLLRATLPPNSGLSAARAPLPAQWLCPEAKAADLTLTGRFLALPTVLPDLSPQSSTTQPSPGAEQRGSVIPRGDGSCFQSGLRPFASGWPLWACPGHPHICSPVAGYSKGAGAVPGRAGLCKQKRLRALLPLAEHCLPCRGPWRCSWRSSWRSLLSR